jgi:hypothetical protein
MLARDLPTDEIFLFDLGEAILPPRPQFNCAVVLSGGQGVELRERQHILSPNNGQY